MTRRRKLLVAAASLLVAAVVATAVWVRTSLPGRVKEIVLRAISERYGVAATADEMTLSVLEGTASLHGLRIRDGATIVLEAERVDGRASFREFLDARYDFRELVLVRPVLRLVIEPDGRTNLSRILATPPKTPPAPGPGDVVVLRSARVEDGRVEYVDPVVDKKEPLRLVVRGVAASVTELQLGGEPATPCAADLRLDCEIEQKPEFPARVSVVAWRTAPGVRPALAALHGAATGCDLAQLPQYVSKSQRAAIGGSVLHLVANIQAVDDVIGPGAIVGEVDGTRTVLPMHVGGTTAEPVFELDSSLGSLLKIPLDRFGTVGDVVVGSGKSAWRGASGAAVGVGKGVVDAGSSVGSGFVDAAGSVGSGDPLGALAAAGGGAVGGVKSIGSGLVAGVKSIFGIGTDTVSHFTAEEAAAFDARVTDLHAGRRAAMLQAALASVPEGPDGGRRTRIEAEVAAAAQPPSPPAK
jgi:hypothetical protein